MVRPGNEAVAPFRRPVSITHQIPRKAVSSMTQQYDLERSPSQDLQQPLTGERPVEIKSQLVQPATQSDHLSEHEQQGLAENPSSSTTLLRWWAPELLGCIVAAACVVAQAVILYVFDDRPQDDWPSTVLTLNGTIALLATICRSAVMVAVAAILSQAKWNLLAQDGKPPSRSSRLADYAILDDASRGLAGSAEVLWRFRGLRMACLGAALTIASLGLGPLTQLVITYRADTIVDTQAPGSVMRVGMLNESHRYHDGNQYIYGGSRSPSHTEHVALLQGVMYPNITAPEVSCATGRCDWPIVPTVGICGSCVDRTDELELTFSDYDDSLVCEARWPLANTRNMGDMALDRNCSGPHYKYGMRPLLHVRPETSSDGRSPTQPGGSSGSMGVYLILGVAPNHGDDIGPARAYECGFYMCVQARNVSVVGGVIHDRVERTWHNNTYNETGAFNAFHGIPSRLFNHDPAEAMGFTNDGVGMVAHMKDRMNGTVMSNNHKPPNPFFYPDNSYVEGLHRALGDIDAWVARVAESLSTSIRIEGQPRGLDSGDDAEATNERYRGNMYSTQIFIEVRWGWLAFPAVVVLLTSGYLVFEMARTARIADVRPWKHDALLPLLMDVDRDLQELANHGLKEPHGIRKRVGTIPVRFPKSGDRRLGLNLD